MQRRDGALYASPPGTGLPARRSTETGRQAAGVADSPGTTPPCGRCRARVQPAAPRAAQGVCRIASTAIFSRTTSDTNGRLWLMPKLLRENSASKSPPQTSRRNSGLR